MTTPPAAVGQQPLLAVITPLTYVLLRASDRNGIAQQLLAMAPGTVLACCSFVSSEPAMCWLTDPGAIKVVSNCAGQGDDHPASFPAVSAGWLAVINRGSRSCFDVDRSGVGGVVQLLQTSPAALCVAALFSAPAEAYHWLAGHASDAVLELLASTAASCTPDAGRHPPVSSTDALGIESAPLVAATQLGRSGSRASAVDKGAWRADGSAASVGVDSQLTTTSWGGTHDEGSWTGGSAPAPPVAMPAACGGAVRSGPCSSRRQVGLDSSTSVQATRRPAPRGGAASLKRLRWEGGQASTGERGSCDGDACAPPRRSSPASVKRARLCEEDGPLAGLNPVGVIPDGSEPTFTFGTVRKMMGESLAAWEKADVDEALRRDADLRVQPGAAGKNGGCAKTFDLVLVATRTAGGSCTVGVQGRSPLAEANASGAPGAGGARQGDGVQPVHGPISRMASDRSWTAVYARLYERSQSTFVSGGPGVGKTCFLRGFVPFLRHRLSAPNAIVVVAPTGSAAKTAKGVTYHSFFGFVKEYKMQLSDPAQEAARMLALERWKPIARRLAKVEVLLVDEIFMVPADNLDVMYELLRQSRMRHARPFAIYAFGDFLQLSPPSGKMAFTAKCWQPVFGEAFLELTHVYRQDQPDFVAALNDARFGRCTTVVEKLMDECAVSEEQYKALECTVLHLMPRHEDVRAHNLTCLARLCPGKQPDDFIAIDSVKVDPIRESRLQEPNVDTVSSFTRDAALLDCIAPRLVQHFRQARVMLITNQFLGLGLFHGSIGCLVDYNNQDGAPVLQFENQDVVPGMRSAQGVRDAGADWIEVCCPPIDFEARIFSRPGCVAVRLQVPLVLGWAITVHRSQSLTLSEAVLDVGEAFGAGMVLAAMSRVSDKRCMHVRSFSGSRLLADRTALHIYREGTRL